MNDMDAQNAAESDPTKASAGASLDKDPSQAKDKKQQLEAGSDGQAPADVKRPSSAKDGKSKINEPASSNPRPDDATDDRDSDAETIVLPGKDGHSPSKVRKVRQEDKGESDGDGSKMQGQASKDSERPSVADGAASGSASRAADSGKKKRLSGAGSGDRDRLHRNNEGSSGLSSAPTSPPHRQQQENAKTSRRDHARRNHGADSSPSDSDTSSHPKSPNKSALREKLKSGDRVLSQKRKAPKNDSDEEADGRKARRQRTTSGTLDSGRTPRDQRSVSAKTHEDRNRSISPPHARQHRRSASTQLASQNLNGLTQKKRRLPPPLQPTEYQSDESSASGSPHPRNNKLRSLTTPAPTDSAISPAKMGPHKKHLDAHGQTLLARACARGEYDVAKQRLGERPEDLNVADYAGNTPLQIAAINGCEDIVKLLVDAGCNLDCVNYDKDTPLLDAVDNGHLGVVKILLDAGVNPRKANVNGEEPIDRVTEDTDNADEIRALLIAAKKRAGGRRRTSEERSHNEHHDSAGPESPRRSPAATLSGAAARRGGTVRATKTRNDLLYMPLDEKTLRQAAGRGDEETVARILQVKEGFDDPESMVAAARGGHDLVIQLLLGLGGASPDPAPVKSVASEFATPILAAIGQENIKVLELLLEQQSFDPTKRYKGESYYEIARKRQGPNWREEEHMLKKAYDEYKQPRKDKTKTKSPGRRDEKRSRREEAREDTRSHRRKLSSPTREADSKKKSPSKLSSPREKRRSDSFSTAAEEHPLKGSRSRREERLASAHTSDREVSPTLSQKTLKGKRTESDAAGLSSEGEASKPRRKLVSKGELRGERERQRRASMASNASAKEPSSPQESRNDETSEKHKLSEKYHDRTKALKRDESTDRSGAAEGSGKRHRTSVTPDRPSNGEKDEGELPVKRRRLDAQGQEKRSKGQASADGRSSKAGSTRDAQAKPSKVASKDREGESETGDGRRDSNRRESGRSVASDRSIHVKSEDVDIEMPDLTDVKEADPKASGNTATPDEDEEVKKQLADEDEDIKAKKLAEEAKAEEERERAAAEEKRQREQEEAQKKKEAEEKRKREEEEVARKMAEEEEARKLREQQERERREAEELRRKQEEEEIRRLQEEKKKKEEEEKRRQEEERQRREQLEREAAEEARRQREEEERKERERRERLHKEEMERKRAAREAEARRARLDKLPPLLRWLDTCTNPKSALVAEKFRHVQGVRYDTIRPEANHTPEGREQWLLNTDVALLLGEKDLSLSRYTAWEHVPASQLAKKTLWRTEWTRYSLLSEKFMDLGVQLPGYYGDEEPTSLRFQTKERLKSEAWDRFFSQDMFFIKVSDFMYTVPNIPHLRDITIAVEYRELLESEAQAIGWRPAQKWKQDPDASRYKGFAPRHKYYVNGTMVGEEIPTPTQTSKTPFPEKRVPRRGLVQVFPDDPDYTRICLEQGLTELIKDHGVSQPVNGLHSPPMNQHTAPPVKSLPNGTNGHVAPGPESNGHGTNGGHAHGINGGA